MKKFILSFFVIGGFALYTIYYGSGGTSISAPNPTIAVNNKNVPNTTTIKTTVNSLIANNTTPVQIQTPVQNIPPKVKVATVNNGQFKDGQYTGTSADAYYGYVQVEAIIANGRLTDVVFLDYPQDRNTSVRINSRAMPILRQEAIAAQSANVNGVSGASATSPAFVESLTSALNQARV
jgi:uncharacterized protein with FMN-binding domain